MSSVNADIRKRLAEVDASIRGLQYTRASLLQQLNMPPAARRRCPILANISREITSKIFLYSLDPFPSYTSSPANPRRAPMQLLQVCRTWRSIALESTPGLWTNLNLDFGRMPQALLEDGNLEKFIDEYVARAGTHPLSLHLRGGHKLPDTKGRQLISAILQRLSPRIQVLQMFLDYRYYPENVPDFPLLQELTHNIYSHGCRRDPVAMFGAAPQLRKVNSYGGLSPSLFNIPWKNVTVFTGPQLSFGDCVHILRSAPSLVECTLEEPYLDEDTTTTISHPGLKSLTLRGDGLCEFLTLPAVQQLRVFSQPIESVHLLPFISRSSSSLVKLTSPKIPLDSLSDMSSLTELNLSTDATFPGPSTEYLAQFFGLLDRTKHQDVLPQLQMLELDPCSPYVSTVLVDALSSRCTVLDGAASLRSFRQFWVHGTPGDALQGYFEAEGFDVALQALAKRGLEIYIGLRTLEAWLFKHQGTPFA
ncbi:hypothetical protein K438DRAFT_1962142 [Mycena galopus ATCC 62051]|nr:hypothetical protein K438DRAFT_1962142 [Mycena galopus ATCC 62051]